MIEEISQDGTCACHGEISIVDDTTVEITELPVRTWTQNYKENVLEPMLHGSEKTPAVIRLVVNTSGGEMQKQNPLNTFQVFHNLIFQRQIFTTDHHM